MFVFVGLGLAWIARVVSKKRWYWNALSVVLVLSQLISNFSNSDQSQNYGVDIIARTALTTLPNNSILLCSGDLQFNPTLYLSICENVRPDVTVLSVQLLTADWYIHSTPILIKRFPGITFPGLWHRPGPNGFSLQKFFEANIDSHPIFVYGGDRPGDLKSQLDDQSLQPVQFYHWTHGLAERIYQTEKEPVNLMKFARAHAAAFLPLEKAWTSGRIVYCVLG